MSDKEKPERRPRSRINEDILREQLLQGQTLQKAGEAAGFAPASAAYNVCRKINKDKTFQEALRNRSLELRERHQLHTDEIIALLIEVALGSISNVYEEDGTFDLAKCTERGADCLIESIESLTVERVDGTTQTRHKVKLYSKLNAINQLRDTFGLRLEPRRNAQAELERIAQEFRDRARKQFGRELSLEEAVQWIRPKDSEPVS